MHCLAIDLGGTRIKMGLLEDGEILVNTLLPAESNAGLSKRLKDVESAAKRLLDKANVSVGSVAGVGVAFPGIVDANRCRVLSTCGKYDDAGEIDFKSWAEVAFGKPLVMENDANAALLGECRYGSAKGKEDAVLMTLGTGIGTAALMGGKLVRGKHSQAGCLGGHITVAVKGRPCSCGGVGCAEAESGSLILPTLIREHVEFENSALVSFGQLDFAALFSAYRKGDSVANDVFEHCASIWAVVVENMIHAYDPDTIVLSGGIMNSADVILPFLRKRVLERAWIDWGDPEFVLTENPEASVLWGLAALVKEA